MLEKINQEVSVLMYYDAEKRVPLPWRIKWQTNVYAVGKLGYYHKVKVGDTLHHIFELVDKDNTLWFRLNLDTSNLHWTLEAVSDGLAD